MFTTVVAGILLAFATTQAAPSLAWGTQTRLSTVDNSRPEVLRTGTTSAIAVWMRGDKALARRTTDGGTTWSGTSTLASGLAGPMATASSGAKVDLTYVKRVSTPGGGSASRLYYRRSLDGGKTWQKARAMTSTTSRIADSDVARHANGQVSIVWTGLTTGKLYMRTSTNGGTTFGTAKLIGSTNNWEPGRTVIYLGEPVVAIGTGVTYVAYMSARDTLAIRRSTNRGATWSGAKVVSKATSPSYSLVAAGSNAVLGYTPTSSGAMRAVFRRTTDKGTTWSTSRGITTVPAGEFSAWPQFSTRGSVLAVVFKSGPPGDSPVFYRESADFGLTWTARTRVSLENVDDSDPEPGGVAIMSGGKRLAAWNENRGDGAEGLWVRMAQP